MKYSLKTPLRGGHLLLDKRLLNKTKIVGVFSRKTRIPLGLDLELPKDKKAWVLTEKNKIYFAHKSSRYIIKSQGGM